MRQASEDCSSNSTQNNVLERTASEDENKAGEKVFGWATGRVDGKSGMGRITSATSKLILCFRSSSSLPVHPEHIQMHFHFRQFTSRRQKGEAIRETYSEGSDDMSRDDTP